MGSVYPGIANHSNDTLLYSSITNSNGIAVADVTLTETSNLYAHFDEITGKYPSSNSNTVQVEYYNWRDTYQPVEWIASSGTQYINTNYVPKTDTIWELDANFIITLRILK